MVLGIAGIAAIAVWLLLRSGGPPLSDAPLPVIAPVPAFSLIERTGEPMTRDSLLGKVWLADFVFTTCAGPCPEGTARVAIMMADEPPLMSYDGIKKMAEITKDMMLSSLEAFKDRDTVRAREISDQDDEVDDLYDDILRELLVLMTEDSAKIEPATHLTWVAHNLERIADRVTNICERIVYLVDGTIHEMNVSKY